MTRGPDWRFFERGHLAQLVTDKEQGVHRILGMKTPTVYCEWAAYCLVPQTWSQVPLKVGSWADAEVESWTAVFASAGPGLVNLSSTA